MPGTLDRYKGFPAIAGSAINPGVPVQFGGGVERGVIPVATNSLLAVGMIDTRIASKAQGDPITVYEHGAVVEGIAAASMGQGAEVAFAVPSQGFAPVAAASGVLRASVGVTMTPAAPGEYFALYVRPRVLGGLA
jgi:hypothetical protein